MPELSFRIFYIQPWIRFSYPTQRSRPRRTKTKTESNREIFCAFNAPTNPWICIPSYMAKKQIYNFQTLHMPHIDSAISPFDQALPNTHPIYIAFKATYPIPFIRTPLSSMQRGPNFNIFPPTHCHKINLKPCWGKYSKPQSTRGAIILAP